MNDPRQWVDRIRRSLSEGRIADARTLALDWQRRSPQLADAQFWLANAYLAGGEAKLALPLLQRVVRLAPSSADAHNNLGAALRQLGRPEEALPCFEKALALSPQHAEAHLSVGQLQRAAGRVEKGAEHFLAALQLNPSFTEAWLGLGESLRQLGRAPDALSVYRQYLQRNPKDAEVWNNLGVTAQAEGLASEAEKSFREAIALRPTYALALAHLAALLLEHDRWDEALPLAERAYAASPNDPTVANNLAILFLRAGRASEAVPVLRRALHGQPDHAEALHNLANALYAVGETEEALARLQPLVLVQPHFRSAAFNLSAMLLTEGRFEEGWPLYEHRVAPWRERFSLPAWDGVRPLAGRRLLLHAEQGLGDTLHFARYAPMLADLGAEVIFEVQPSLLPVLEPLRARVTLLARGQPLPAFDEHLPLLGAPGRLWRGLENLPPPGPWVSVSEDRIHAWQTRLGPRREPRLAVVWSGNPAHRNDHNRSLPLAAVANTLADFPGEIITLQKEVRSSDLPVLQGLNQWKVLGQDLQDFADTAAVLKQVDLLLTVDTSVAHLAAALGVPTWIFLPDPPDWRWLRGRTDSVWYPSVRLFRQSPPGNWAEALREVKAALATGKISH